MGRLIKWLFLLAFVGCLLYAGSYAGARTRVGQYLGTPLPEMGVRTVRLAYDGVPELPARPRAWEFRYSSISVNGNRPGKVFVSLKGKILGAVPKDLDQRLEAWRKSKEVQ